MVKHSLVSADINDSRVWYKDRGNITATFLITVQEGNGYIIESKLITQSGKEIVIHERDIEARYQSSVSLLIDRSLVELSTNRLEITITDILDGVEGESETYSYTIIGEDRDTFSINRSFEFRSEWLLYGNMSLSNTDGAQVNTLNSKGLAGIAVNKLAIEMDGRSSIYKITVDADEDTAGDSSRNYKYDTYSDRGDNIVTTYNLGDINIFNNIKGIRSK